MPLFTMLLLIDIINREIDGGVREFGRQYRVLCFGSKLGPPIIILLPDLRTPVLFLVITSF